MIILGINSGFTLNQHDASAVLIVNGQVVAAIEEERLIRVKTPRGFFPIYAISAVLKFANISLSDVDYVAHPGDSYKDLENRLRNCITHHFGCCPKIILVNHQLAHLASAYYASGFKDAMCVSYDAYGDKLSAALAVGNGSSLQVIENRDFSNSLGHFYATMTSYLGFQPGEDEYKIMGLSPYGKANYDLTLFAAPSDDGYQVNNKFINYNNNPTVFEPFYTDALVDLLGPARHKNEPISQRHMDIAYATQQALESCAQSLIQYTYKITGKTKLCLAGGVALNCSCNYVLSNLSFIDDIFIQPAASDRGLSLGAALYAAVEHGEEVKPINNVFWGPSYSDDDILSALRVTGINYQFASNPAYVGAELVSEGAVVAWFQGRSEFGPRALGHRSILADPTNPKMKDILNSKIKFREGFRPFAPSVIEENASQYFDLKNPSPYMTIATGVVSEHRENLPSVTHINNTARVQTVSKNVDPLYHELISTIATHNGFPIVINTSFNVKGQPIAERPIDAISTFMGSGIDQLIIGNYILQK